MKPSLALVKVVRSTAMMRRCPLHCAKIMCSRHDDCLDDNAIFCINTKLHRATCCGCTSQILCAQCAHHRNAEKVFLCGRHLKETDVKIYLIQTPVPEYTVHLGEVQSQAMPRDQKMIQENTVNHMHGRNLLINKGQSNSLSSKEQKKKKGPVPREASTTTVLDQLLLVLSGSKARRFGHVNLWSGEKSVLVREIHKMATP